MVDYQEWLGKQAQSTKWYNRATKERFESQRAWRRDMSAQERGLKDVIEIAPGTFRYSWPAPPMVIEAAKKALDEGHTDYIPGKGFLDYREAIADMALREFGITADPEKEIQPTHGISFTFNLTMRGFIDPNDDILMIDPDYFLSRIPPNVNVIPVPLIEPSDPKEEWSFDIEELVNRITPKSKMLVMANGNNPTGHLYTKKELEQISEVVQEKDLLVFSDELYARCVFEGKKHYSIGAFPGMEGRTITAYSFHKMESMSGMRIGWVIASQELTRVFTALMSHETECINTIGQKAGIAAASKETQEWIQENTIPEVKKRLDFCWAKLNKIEGVNCAKSTGTYYLFPNITNYNIGTIQDIVDFFIKEAGVLVRTGYGKINGPGHFRVSSCAPWDRLSIGLEKISEALEKLRK
jgi:aspartate/methionine/tyrosine aminotransferase